jgi:hypothetical protein
MAYATLTDSLGVNGSEPHGVKDVTSLAQAPRTAYGPHPSPMEA